MLTYSVKVSDFFTYIQLYTEFPIDHSLVQYRFFSIYINTIQPRRACDASWLYLIFLKLDELSFAPFLVIMRG
jgi:hypothetical protein